MKNLKSCLCKSEIECFIERLIFSVKWLLIPFYLKLFWTLLVLLWEFYTAHTVTKAQIVHTLEDVDIVMIANLVKMIITGSYTSSVNKNHGEANERVSSGMLKVKIGMSLIGVSSIYLLTEFLNDRPISQEMLFKLLTIHGAFLIGALIMSIMDYLHVKSDCMKDLSPNDDDKEKT